MQKPHENFSLKFPNAMCYACLCWILVQRLHSYGPLTVLLAPCPGDEDPPPQVQELPALSNASTPKFSTNWTSHWGLRSEWWNSHSHCEISNNLVTIREKRDASSLFCLWCCFFLCFFASEETWAATANSNSSLELSWMQLIKILKGGWGQTRKCLNLQVSCWQTFHGHA